MNLNLSYMDPKSKWLKRQKFLLKKSNIFKHLEQVVEQLEKGCDYKKSLKKDFNPVLYWKKRIKPIQKDESSDKPKKRGILDDLKEVASAMSDLKAQLNLPSGKKLLEVAREHAGEAPKGLIGKIKDAADTWRAYSKIKQSLPDKSLKGVAQRLKARAQEFKEKDISSLSDALKDAGVSSLREFRDKIKEESSDKPKKRGLLDDLKEVADAMSGLKAQLNLPSGKKLLEVTREHAGEAPKGLIGKIKDAADTWRAYSRVKQSLPDKSLKGVAQRLKARTQEFKEKGISSLSDALKDAGVSSLREFRDKIKKDDMPHAPGSPEDSAHDVVEEGSPLRQELLGLKGAKAKAKMLAHLRTLKDKSKLRSEKNRLKGKD